MRGVSGSGKSTLAKQLAPQNAVICSADNFFERLGHFDPTKLGEAHGECLRLYTESVQANVPCIIVDNTNTTLWEISPYVALAQAYGREFYIIEIETDLSAAELAARNVHGVPEAGIEAMKKRISENSLLPWWPRKIASVVPHVGTWEIRDGDKLEYV